MGMDVCRGTVSNLGKSEESGKTQCKVGESLVLLHRDLERNIAEGDEVIVAGEIAEGAIQALALHNISKDKISDVDASNHVLGIGFAGFLSLCGFVLAYQYWRAGDMTLSYANVFMCVSGFVVMIWAIMKAAKLRQAAKKVYFVS